MFKLFIKSKSEIPSNKKIKHLIERNNINKIDTKKLIYYIDKIMWELRFHLHTKGAIYLKTAICLSYVNHSFLHNQKKLFETLSNFFHTTPKNIRNCIDHALNSTFKYEFIQYHINYFEGYYNGEKISLKYFLFFIVEYINLKMK